MLPATGEQTHCPSYRQASETLLIATKMGLQGTRLPRQNGLSAANQSFRHRAQVLTRLAGYGTRFCRRLNSLGIEDVLYRFRSFTRLSAAASRTGRW